MVCRMDPSQRSTISLKERLESSELVRLQTLGLSAGDIALGWAC
jgi:hypothetical protein